MEKSFDTTEAAAYTMDALDNIDKKAHQLINGADLSAKETHRVEIEVLLLLMEAFSAGRLQGLTEAEGVVPKVMPRPEYNTEVSTAIVFSFNNCRLQTLDNLAKLKEGK